MTPGSTRGLRIARGPVLQVHPADREQRISLPARQAREIFIRVRNVGTEPLPLSISTSAPWLEVARAEVAVAPGATETVCLRVPPLTLSPGGYSFTVTLRGAQLLGDQELVLIHLQVTEPVTLQVREPGGSPIRARAWEAAWIELAVRRSDGEPCDVASVSADPWPHWLLRSEIRPDGVRTLVRLLAQAPGRSDVRCAELTLEASQPGIERATHTVKIGRQPAPVLVWEDSVEDPLTREKLQRDDPEWAEQGLSLPDLLPGDAVTASYRIRNVGDAPAEVRVVVESTDAQRRWLRAGFGPPDDPEEVSEVTLPPRHDVTVRLRLEAPLPPDRWVKDAAGRMRRGRTPARDLVWPGALVRVEAADAPLTLTRRVTGSVLGALQPVPLESRLLPAAIDLGLSLFAAAMVYIVAWTLLGDYHLARLAEPLMAALHARFYTLAGGLALVLWWVLYALLLTGCQAFYGTTPGKAYAGMELRRADGSKPSSLRCGLRGLLTALLLPLLCWGAVASAVPRNLLDRLLGTRVVRVVSLWDD